jgi:hypothetical protein
MLFQRVAPGWRRKLTEPFGSIWVDIRPSNAYFKIELNGSVIFFGRPGLKCGKLAIRAGNGEDQ